MNLQQAGEACKKLGAGWRLPTRDESEALYKNLHLKGEGNFNKKTSYWTSSMSPDDWNLSMNFSDGRAYIDVEDSLNLVRAVRNL